MCMSDKVQTTTYGGQTKIYMQTSKWRNEKIETERYVYATKTGM